MASRFELHVHLVWGTWRRKPLVTDQIKADLYEAIADKCFDLGCSPCVVGGTADHVHVLSRLHPTIAVSRLVAEIKGFSAHAMTRQLGSSPRLRWQRGYGAFSVSSDDVPIVENYVRNQERHHAMKALEPGLEPPDVA